MSSYPPLAHLFRVRKQPRSGLREEKVPYLIISSHKQKHIVQGFYMAAVTSVRFSLAVERSFLAERSDLVVGNLGAVVIWALVFGVCQDKSHKLWSQSLTISMSVCLCVRERGRNKDTLLTPNHTSSFYYFPPARPPACGLRYNNRVGHPLIHTAACALIPMISCGFCPLSSRQIQIEDVYQVFLSF